MGWCEELRKVEVAVRRRGGRLLLGSIRLVRDLSDVMGLVLEFSWRWWRRLSVVACFWREDERRWLRWLRWWWSVFFFYFRTLFLFSFFSVSLRLC